MDKTAQERSFMNKLREKTNLFGKALEGFNSEFASMMDRLRSTDERIRAHGEGIRDLAKSAQQYVNRRDYLAAAIDLSEFHKKCRYISAELAAFIKSIDTKNFKVLLDQFDEEQKKQLFSYNPDEELNLDQAAVIDAPIEAQAGLLDVVHNLTSERGKAMRALEKNFSLAFLSDLKKNSISIVDKTNRFLTFVLTTFKRLATALARRKIKEYVALSKNFIDKFSGKPGTYDVLFRKYFTDNIEPLKQQHNALVEEQKSTDAAKQKALEDAALQRRQQQEAILQRQQELHQSGNPQPLPFPSPNDSTATLNRLDVLQDAKEDNKPFDLTQQKAAKFINNLVKIAESEDPKKLLLEILSFSESLENTDPETSLKLLAIGEGIVQDYKLG